MTATAEQRVGVSGFRHEAYLYRGEDDFLQGAARFVREGVQAGEPLLVAIASARWHKLRQRVGDHDGVLHVDMAELGRNPGRIIPAWREFLAASDAGTPVRGIGEPVWHGRTAAEVREAQRHELLLNAAFEADDRDFWLLCPYDASLLPEQHLDEAVRSHAWVSRDGAPRRSGSYQPWQEDSLERLDDRLPEPPVDCDRVPFGDGDLAGLRDVVARRAGLARLPRHRAELMVLALNEITTNSLRHGGGAGELLLWQQPGELVAEVRDGGHIRDPLAGRARPGPSQTRGRGLWMVHQVSDLVQLRTGPAGTAVRVHFSL